jgi:predicted component of viral defense system (DUF524 family)
METVGSIPSVTSWERESELDDYAVRGVPAMCWRDDSPVLFECFQLRESTDYLIDVTVPLSKIEAEGKIKERACWPFSDRLKGVFRSDPPKRWREVGPNSVVISGQLKLRNHAGILDLSTETGATLRAEVVCRKIGYLDEFRTLLNEVAEFLAELLLQYDSPVSVVFDLTDARKASIAAVLFQMRYVMADDNLPLAIEEVLRQIHAKLLTRITIRSIDEVEEPSIETMMDDFDLSSFEVGGPLSGLFRGYTPRGMPVLEVAEVVDTPENRYIKYFLEECGQLAQWLSFNLEAQGKQGAAREAGFWVQQFQEILSHDVWRGVGIMRQMPANSQVLLRRRGYKEMLRFDLSLQLGLSLPWSQGAKLAEGLTGDIRPVNELYEYWCFFLLRKILAEICQIELPDNGSFLRKSEDGLQVRLVKGHQSQVSFVYRELPERQVTVALFYNRKFKRPGKNHTVWEGSYTASFDPDYSVAIKVKEGGTVQKHWLHFDAKYRLETSELSQVLNDGLEESELVDASDDEVGYELEISRVHRREDLFKMHTYRDGILSTRGAYILFPGDGSGVRTDGKDQNFFVRHPSSLRNPKSFMFPSVGAFDLCPGRTTGQLESLQTFLVSVLEAVSNGNVYREEHGLFT